jgi:NADPH:quinone reductase
MNEPSFIGGKAVTYSGRGGHEVIEILDRQVRPPAAGEVRIAVKAAGVNPTDILFRTSGLGDQTSIVVPGMDAAGYIESVGTGVSRLLPGEKVMAVVTPRRPEGGAQAQYIVVPVASVVSMPDGVSFAQAATLPMNGLTALRALELAELAPGQWLAVTGGAGFLAHYMIAIAKRHGVKIIADAKMEEIELVRSYGADIVVERGADFAGAVRSTRQEGVDALLDTANLTVRSLGAIRDGGIYIPVRGWTDQAVERGIKIRPVLVLDSLERTEWLEQLRNLVTDQQVMLRVAREYPPEQVADAQRALEGGGVRGRQVIIF